MNGIGNYMNELCAVQLQSLFKHNNNKIDIIYMDKYTKRREVVDSVVEETKPKTPVDTFTVETPLFTPVEPTQSKEKEETSWMETDVKTFEFQPSEERELMNDQKEETANPGSDELTPSPIPSLEVEAKLLDRMKSDPNSMFSISDLYIDDDFNSCSSSEEETKRPTEVTEPIHAYLSEEIESAPLKSTSMDIKSHSIDIPRHYISKSPSTPTA